jgi:hypothetical protein
VNLKEQSHVAFSFSTEVDSRTVERSAERVDLERCAQFWLDRLRVIEDSPTDHMPTVLACIALSCWLL